VGPITSALLAQLAEEVVEADVLEGTFGCALLRLLCYAVHAVITVHACWDALPFTLSPTSPLLCTAAR